MKIIHFIDYWFEELLEGRTVTKAEEAYYIVIYVLARLSKKRKLEQYNPDTKGENEDVTKVQTQINNLMKVKGKIDNFQEKETRKFSRENVRI